MTITLDATNKTVVGTDLSGRAGVAVDWAAERAAHLGGSLLIVMSVPEVPIPRRSRMFDALATGDWPNRLLEMAEDKLAALKEQVLEKHPDLSVETQVVKGVASYVLAQASKTADMVVIGARGEHAPLKVRALGGTADAVVAHAHGPVAVVTDHGDRTPQGPVVVGVDDSPEADAALELAAAEATGRGVSLQVIHAWDIAPWAMGPMGVTAMQTLPPVETLKEGVETYITPTREKYPDLDVDVQVVEARPSAALVDASQGASVLVVGSRGLGGFTGLLLGSTSKEILRGADCPVIVTRAPETNE